MSTKTVKTKFDSDANALKRDLDQINTKMESVTRTQRFTALATSITAAYAVALPVVQKMATALGSFTQMAVAQEDGAKRLKVEVERLGFSYSSVKTDLEALFAQQQRWTKYGDDVSRHVLQQLLAKTDDLAGSTKNLGLVYNLAEKHGLSLDAAVKAVAFTMKGNLTQVGRYIPELKNWAAANIDLEGTSKGARLALQMLTMNVAGFAFEAGGAEQSQARLNNAIGDMKELIGERLIGDMSRHELALRGIAVQAERAAAALAGTGEGGGGWTGIPLVDAYRGFMDWMASIGQEDLYQQRLEQMAANIAAGGTGFLTYPESVTTAARPPRRPNIPSDPGDPIGGDMIDFDMLGPVIKGFGQDVAFVNEELFTQAHAFSQAEIAAAEWAVAWGDASMLVKDVGIGALQQQLRAELQFENIKNASLKRVVTNTLSAIGSEAAARAAFEGAAAVASYAWGDFRGAREHAKAAGAYGSMAGGAALGFFLAGGEFEEAPTAAPDLGSGSAASGASAGSARTVAAGAAAGVINFNLTVIHHGSTLYVGEGGVRELVQTMVPAIQDEINSGALRLAG